MSKYLLREQKLFRADTEMEANQLVVDLKKKFDVSSSRITRRDKKDETYFIIEIRITVNSERDPSTSYSIPE